MPQFDAGTFSSQIFWLVIIFSGFLAICHRIYFPKLAALLKDRAAKLNDERLRLEVIQKEIENLEKEQAERVAQTRYKIECMLHEAEAESNVRLQKQLNSLDVEISETIQGVKESLGRQEAAIYASLNDMVTSCVDQVMEKLNNPVGPLLSFNSQNHEVGKNAE
jgi:F-type H+-transporting ATPase subunit b